MKKNGTFNQLVPWPNSDLNLIVIRKNGESPVKRELHYFLGKVVDAFSCHLDLLRSNLHQDPRNVNDLGNLSPFLSYLREDLIPWDECNALKQLVEDERAWRWQELHSQILDFPLKNSWRFL